MATPRPPSSGPQPRLSGRAPHHRCVPCDYKCHASGEAVEQQFLASLCSGQSPRHAQQWNSSIRKPGQVIEEHDPHGLWAATTSMRDVYFRRLKLRQHQEEDAKRLAKASVRREDLRAKLAARKEKREALMRDAGVPPRPEVQQASQDGSFSDGFSRQEATPSAATPLPAAREVQVSSAPPIRGPCSWASLDEERPRSILGHMKRFRSSVEGNDQPVVITPRCETRLLPTSASSSRPNSARPVR